jgi:hypothetical protein
MAGIHRRDNVAKYFHNKNNLWICTRWNRFKDAEHPPRGDSAIIFVYYSLLMNSEKLVN